MRVIAGSAKGRKLKTLEGLDVRPTTDKVKEAIFSAIQFDLPGAVVLDLFAGSGQMGIEALSRGAETAVFVDRSARSLQMTKENLESVQLAAQAQLHQAEAQSFLQTTAMQFDIAILDPPYRKGFHEKLLPLLGRRQVELAVKYKGEYIGMRESRRTAAFYLKGIPGAPKLRQMCSGLTVFSDIDKVIEAAMAAGQK